MFEACVRLCCTFTVSIIVSTNPCLDVRHSRLPFYQDQEAGQGKGGGGTSFTSIKTGLNGWNPSILRTTHPIPSPSPIPCSELHPISFHLPNICHTACSSPAYRPQSQQTLSHQRRTRWRWRAPHCRLPFVENPPGGGQPPPPLVWFRRKKRKPSQVPTT